jgi:hypothetical protein
MSLEQFYLARDDLQHAFMEGETNQVMASITDRFKAQTCAPYSLKDLFKDKQVEVINKTLLVPMAKAMDYYLQIFKESRSSLETLTGLGAKPPLELQVATDVIFTKEVIALLAEGKVDLARLESIIHEIKNLRMELGKELIALEAQKRIESDVDALAKDPQSIEGLRDLERLISILFRMDLPLNLWRAQNKWYFLVGLLKSAGVSGQAGTKNSPWPDPILRISEYLRVRV